MLSKIHLAISGSWLALRRKKDIEQKKKQDEIDFSATKHTTKKNTTQIKMNEESYEFLPCNRTNITNAKKKNTHNKKKMKSTTTHKMVN